MLQFLKTISSIYNKEYPSKGCRENLLYKGPGMKTLLRIVQNKIPPLKQPSLADIPLGKIHAPVLSAEQKMRGGKDLSGHPAHLLDNRALFS